MSNPAERAGGENAIIAAAFAEHRRELEEAEQLPPRYCEERVADECTRLYKDDWLYVAEASRWYEWQRQRRWAPNRTLAIYDLIRNYLKRTAVAALQDEELSSAERKRIAMALGSAKTIAAVERIMRADQRQAVVLEAFDINPLQLNTPAGVLNLQDGHVSPHERLFLMTKIAAAAPGGDCPLWKKFLARVTGGDEELVAFLQRFAGYCLTGDTSEHVLLFLWGLGSNGKSTFLNTLAGVLGDYATSAPSETFAEAYTERHPTDLAMLRGARLVVVPEIEDGQRWAAAKIKQLTGGDMVRARFMRQDYFEYRPAFKLIFTGNHKPSFRHIDEAIRRRFHLVPFIQTISAAERDPELPEKLRAEWGGILAWAIEGCLSWQESGLAAPACVRDATDAYLNDEDLLQAWLAECCETDANACCPVAELHQSYQAWAERAGEKFFGTKRFSQVLEDHGYERTREGSNRVRSFRGLRLQAIQKRLEAVA